MAIKICTNRVANKNVRSYVCNHEEFTGSNLYSIRRNDKLYVVYSYGFHFPIFIYDFDLGNWFYNTEKYSRTTIRHHSQANPMAANPIYMNTIGMHELIRAGSYVRLAAERVNPEYEEIA